MNEHRIFFIGLPSSGKSRIGSELAKKLRWDYFDTDKLIIDECNKKFDTFGTIQECYTFLGEEKFRKLEKQILRGLIEKTSSESSIISTGGGVILDTDNRSIIKQNGIVIFLNTPIDTIRKRLFSQKERPLFKGKSIEERLNELQSERLPIMKEMADFVIEVTGSVDETCLLIISKL